jgi:hypothetical protein
MIKIMKTTALIAIMAASIAGCTYHRTVVERPIAETPNTTVIVPDDRSDVIVVPNN